MGILVGTLYWTAHLMTTCMSGPGVSMGWTCWHYCDYEQDGTDQDGDVDLRDWAYFQNDTLRWEEN